MMNDDTLNAARASAGSTNVYGRDARRYALHSETSPHNVLYERPAMRQLLGDLRGLAIIDCGCGAGVMMLMALDAGAARVVGFDSDPEIVAYARERLNGRAEVAQANVGERLPTEWEGRFDVAIASLVLHYVRDWDAAMRNFRRLLRSGGRLLFSVNHPFVGAGEPERRYFDIEPVVEYWPPLDLHVTTFRRPLQAMLDALKEHGFTLERIVEPRPADEMRERAPEAYAQLMREPAFILLAARKN